MWRDEARSFGIRIGIGCASLALLALGLILYHSHEVTQPSVLVPELSRDPFLWDRIEESVYGAPTHMTSTAVDCIQFDESSYTAEFYYDDSNDSRLWPVNVLRRMRPVQYEIVFSYAFSNRCQFAVSFKADLHYLDHRGEPIAGEHTPFAEYNVAAGSSLHHTQRGIVSAKVRNHARGMHPIIYDGYALFAGG